MKISSASYQYWSTAREAGQLLTTKWENASLYSALMKGFLSTVFWVSEDFSSSTSPSVSDKSGASAEVDQLLGDAGDAGRSISWGIYSLS
jgi:hypothetical protein